jgi:hypothetical protein
MRTHILAAFLLVSSHAAFAQNVIAPPAEPAPTATAPVEERADWCDAYASWLVAMTPRSHGSPADVRQSQHLEVELNACKIDPQQYERETRAEADAVVEIAQG